MSSAARAPVERRATAPSGPSARSGADAPAPWHALPGEAVLARLESAANGLSEREAAERLARLGPQREQLEAELSQAGAQTELWADQAGTLRLRVAGAERAERGRQGEEEGSGVR